MPAAARIYRRLPGRSGSLVAYYRIYRAADHLLSVTAQGFSESYRRFYYRDIQAIIVHRTIFGKVFTGIFAGLLGITALFWILLFMTPGSLDIGYVITNSILTAFFGIPLLINFWLGPTCRCYVKTAVQTERLYAVGRVRTAQKFLARLRPLILEAQAVAPPATGPGAGQPSTAATPGAAAAAP